MNVPALMPGVRLSIPRAPIKDVTPLERDLLTSMGRAAKNRLMVIDGVQQDVVIMIMKCPLCLVDDFYMVLRFFDSGILIKDFELIIKEV